jgi:putative transcriptional regulator
MPIFNEIKNMRSKQNVTQEQLANAAGVSRQTIIAIEKGNYTPSLMLAMQLAKFFKISVEELFYIK